MMATAVTWSRTARLFRRTFLCSGTLLQRQLLFSSCPARMSPGKDPEEEKERQRKLMSRGLPKRRALPGVDRVILVASGKGGVGKSTVAANLALELSRCPDRPSRVGVLDADVYGPSTPIVLGLQGADAPAVAEDGRMIPLVNYGIKCMSMGFLTSRGSGAVVWRGPMVMGAVEKLAHGTDWAPLDYLIVDLPPGTGDIHLSLAQTLQVFIVLATVQGSK